MIKYLLITCLIVVGVPLEGVQELTDSNFQQTVVDDGSFWVVLFAADWCGHCQQLKPQFQKVASRLAQLGVKTGIVDENNNDLIGKYVVDQETHMVSYPKMKVFLGQEVLSDVPSNVRQADQIYHWFIREYKMGEMAQEEL